LSRWWWRLLLWPLLAMVLAVGIMPFTGQGTRTLVATADRLLPLEIQYRGGTLAGQLQLTRLVWAGDGVRVELQDLVAQLAPACLWYSKICFDQLQARQLDVLLLPGPDAEHAVADPTTAVDPDAPAALVVLPVHLEAASLVVENTLVQWQGGQWRQGRMRGGVVMSGSTIAVASTVVAKARLELRDSDTPPSVEPIVLPRIDLPLELVVEELLLTDPSWSVYGQEQQLQALILGGSWRNMALRLQQLDIRSAELGELSLHGGIDFAGPWPLELDARLTAASMPGWPAPLGRTGSLSARGDLNALQLQLELPGAASLAATAELDALDRDLPFSFNAQAHWDEVLALAEHVPLPEPVQDLVLQAPLQLAVNGSLQEQRFQLDGSASGLGYPAMALQAAGALRSDSLTVEDMRLQDAAGANTLWGSAQLSFGQALQWSAQLESGGFQLPPMLEYAQGTLSGRLHFNGSSAGQDWQVAVTEVDVRGEVNGLPAVLGGQAGLRQDLSLAATDLRAEVNGAQLTLQASGTSSAPARLNVTVSELQRWQGDAQGRLALQATLAADWRQAAFTGSLEAIQWAGLSFDEGAVEGVYRPGRGQASRLDVNVSAASVAGLQLDTLHLLAVDNGASQTLSLRSRGDVEGELSLRGAFAGGRDWAGRLAPTQVQTPYGGWKLDETVALKWSESDAALRISGHCWRNPKTRICPGDSVLGAQGSASLAISGGLEFVAGLFPEQLEVSGELESNLAASWGPDSPLAVNGELAAQRVLITRQYGLGESASVNWDGLTAVIRQSEQGLQLSAQMHREGRRALDLEALLPVSRDGPLAGTLDFQGLRLSALAPFAPNLATLEGELGGRLQLQGTIDHPRALGTLKLSAGRFALVGNPTELHDVELLIEALGDTATMAGSGMLGGGVLNLEGALLSDPEARLELVMSGARHELLLPPYTQVIVSEDIELVLSGSLLDIKGEVNVHEGVLRHEQLPAGSVNISSDVVEVDYSGNVIRQASAFDTRINVSLLIENKFKVVGDMVDATVGGDLRLSQRPGNPLQVFGNLKVIGGELRAYGQLLRIRRGTIAFSGRPDNPEFDVRAQRALSSESTVVGVQLQGTMMQPKLEVYSDPVMPHGEAMSYLLRGRGLDSGADSDGIAMAVTVGSGVVNQSTLVEELNRIPGVSNLAFGAEGTDEDTAATVGGYLGDRLYLSYGMGLYEPVNVLTARLYLQTRLWLEVVSRLENSVDLYYSFDIK
jgi:translocation and assembly module TamB